MADQQAIADGTLKRPYSVSDIHLFKSQNVGCLISYPTSSVDILKTMNFNESIKKQKT